MADITIPGVTSKYNTNQMIDELVKAERIRLDRMEESQSGFEDQKKVWQDLKRRLSELRTISRELFSFQNPFNERAVESSDEHIISGTATREAVESEVEFTVLQVSKADKLMSKSLPRDFEADPGMYTFMVGEKEIKVKFKGGNLKSLVEAINKRGGDYLNAMVVNNTSTTQVMVIEALKPGNDNALTFGEDALAFGEKAGILKRSYDVSRDVSLETASVQRWDKNIDTNVTSIEEGTLTVKSGGELKIPVNPPFNFNGGEMILEFELDVTHLDDTWQPPTPPPGPDVPLSGVIELDGVVIRNAENDIISPPWEAPSRPERVEDMQVLFAGKGGKIIPLPEIDDKSGFHKVKIPLSDFTDGIDSLYIRNNNTLREINIRNIKVYNPEARGDYVPLNPIAQAGDTKLLMDGIEIIRDSNVIDDLLPGVTLTVERASDEPVTLNIVPDRETVKEKIIEFVWNYNSTLEELQILTRDKETVIEEIEHFDDDQREKARERLGLLQGDVSVRQLKSRLQDIMMSPYETDGGGEMRLLAQLGISTNAGTGGGSFDATKLRGYLEIDEDKLDEALKTKLPYIKDLFGKDTDGDLVIDSGVAYRLDDYVKNYSQTGGMIATRLSSLDRQIKEGQRDIDNYNDHLADYEADLKRKYGNMESLLDSMEKNSQAIENFNNSNNSNR